MRSFGGYCRIATALGDTSLRYAHNVRETFRNARFRRFHEAGGSGLLGLVAPHGPRIRRVACRFATAPMRAFFLCVRCLGWRLAQWLHWSPWEPCDVRIGSSRSPYDVRNLECVIAGFFGKRPRSFVLCFRYSTMAITAIFERGTHARRSYQARRGI